MFRTKAIHVTRTLFVLSRVACAAAVAALLLPALSAVAWAAQDKPRDRGIDLVFHSNKNERAAVAVFAGDRRCFHGKSRIFTGNPDWIIFGGYNVSDYGHQSAMYNMVYIYSGAAKELYGGRSDRAQADFNRVTMYGGEVKKIYGGVSGQWPGRYGEANWNEVFINSGTVEEIYGGVSRAPDKQAFNNRVFINGGTVTKSIYGGYSPNSATTNVVTLSGTPSFGKDLGIYGGGWSAPGGNHFTNNELKLDKYRGTSTAAVVSNFQNYTFIWDSRFEPLKAKTVHFGQGFVSSFVQYINTIGPAVPKKVTLIRADTIDGNIKLGTVAGKTLGGATTVSFKWDVRIQDGNNLVATLPGNAPANSFNNSELLSEEELLLYGLGEVELSPETKSLLEGRLGGTVTLTQAADMLAGQGMSAMLSSVSQSSFSIWGTMGGGTSRYNTGSHINSDGIGFMVGAAWRKHTGPGTLTLSPFFAFGWGNYTSHNSFASVGSVKGKGNTNYQGGGLMARYNHTNTGWYGEASVQLGHVKQDYKSSDFLDNYLNETKYAINQMYTSMHFGIGKEIALSNCSVLDVYGKYFWTHTGKKDKDIAGDDYTFAAVNSHRARFGARYTHTIAKGSGEVKPYAGAAYEYEFNGKGRGTVEGYRIADTRLQGSTGLLEAGIDYAPNSKKWAINGGITGFVGKRRGILGQLGIRADF